MLYHYILCKHYHVPSVVYHKFLKCTLYTYVHQFAQQCFDKEIIFSSVAHIVALDKIMLRSGGSTCLLHYQSHFVMTSEPGDLEVRVMAKMV